MFGGLSACAYESVQKSAAVLGSFRCLNVQHSCGFDMKKDLSVYVGLIWLLPSLGMQLVAALSVSICCSDYCLCLSCTSRSFFLVRNELKVQT
jgi:hypothetical protein